MSLETKLESVEIRRDNPKMIYRHTPKYDSAENLVGYSMLLSVNGVGGDICVDWTESRENMFWRQQDFMIDMQEHSKDPELDFYAIRDKMRQKRIPVQSFLYSNLTNLKASTMFYVWAGMLCSVLSNSIAPFLTFPLMGVVSGLRYMKIKNNSMYFLNGQADAGIMVQEKES